MGEWSCRCDTHHVCSSHSVVVEMVLVDRDIGRGWVRQVRHMCTHTHRLATSCAWQADQTIRAQRVAPANVDPILSLIGEFMQPPVALAVLSSPLQPVSTPPPAQFLTAQPSTPPSPPLPSTPPCSPVVTHVRSSSEAASRQPSIAHAMPSSSAVFVPDALARILQRNADRNEVDAVTSSMCRLGDQRRGATQKKTPAATKSGDRKERRKIVAPY